MADPTLGRRSHRAVPMLTLWDEIALPLVRVHEICGAARRSLALHVAAAMGGPIFWIAPQWGEGQLHAPGMAALINPGEVTFLAPKRQDEALWTMEEVLRAGCVSCVVAELTALPSMTAVRRLHLAAETGAGLGLCRPLGLLLTPGQGGAPGIETRHICVPVHRPGRDLWHIERRRARMAPPKAWWLEGHQLRSAPLAEEGARLSPPSLAKE